MKGIKVAGITLVSHISKMLVSLYIIKQIAITYGPEGLGLFGNFMSLVAISATLSGGGAISGIIKYVSEYSHSIHRQLNFLGSALLYTVCASLVIFVVGAIFIKSFTASIFLDQSYTPYIYFFLIMQIFIAFNNYIFGVTNGLKKNSVYASFIVLGNLISFIIAFFGIKYFGIWGAIVAIMAPLICPFIPVFFYTINQRIIKYIRFNSVYEDSKLLSKYSLMILVSSICFPIVEMIIRNLIIQRIGLDAAGFWQAVTKLSTAYLSFYSLFLTFYFIPIISALVDHQSIYSEVKKMLGLIACFFVLMMLFFLCFKNQIIYYALSEDFVPISDLFVLQMIGDFFRVITWVIGFVIVAKAATKLYVISEIVQGAFFLMFAYFELTHGANLQGVIMAYIATCVLYCILVALCFNLFFVKKILVMR